jgi:phage baseplate assembly protein gpV
MVDVHRDDSSTSEPEVHEYSNGTALSQARLAQMLTRENISTVLIVALAAEVLGISDKLLTYITGVC